MTHKNSIILHYGLLLVFTATAVVGTFVLTPPEVPQQSLPATMASMDHVKATLFDKKHALYAHMSVEHAQFLPKNIITAQNINLYLQDNFRSHLTASEAVINPSAPWSFKNAQLHRSQIHCPLLIRSPHLEYNTDTQTFHTTATVQLKLGQTRLSMQGIQIPTKNKTLSFGPHLKGSLSPNDPCTLDFS